MGIKIGNNNNIKNSNFIGDKNEIQKIELNNQVKKEESIFKKIWTYIKSFFIKAT